MTAAALQLTRLLADPAGAEAVPDWTAILS